MKKKHVSIVALWEKAAKAKKTASTSTPNAVVIESNESNMQLALVPLPAQNDGEKNGEAPQPDRGSPTPIVEETASDEEAEMSEIRVDLEALEHDPGKRIPISRYDVNVRDSVRRRYIELGPCQPKNHDFKYRDIDISGHPRHFCHVWFKENKWLEYIVEKRCSLLHCLLFVQG